MKSIWEPATINITNTHQNAKINFNKLIMAGLLKIKKKNNTLITDCHILLFTKQFLEDETPKILSFYILKNTIQKDLKWPIHIHLNLSCYTYVILQIKCPIKIQYIWFWYMNFIRYIVWRKMLSWNKIPQKPVFLSLTISLHYLISFG